MQNCHSESFWATSIGNVMNQVKLAVLSHSEPLCGNRLEKLRIGRNWPFWVILSHFSGNRLEKVANWVKLAIPSHSEPLQWEKLQIGQMHWPFQSLEPLRWKKIGKVANQAKWPFRVILSYFSGNRLESCESGKMAVPSHSEPLWWEKLWIRQNWPFRVILSYFSGKDWKSCKLGKIGRSKSFWATSVKKDWKSCKSAKLPFRVILSYFGGKRWKSCKSGKIGRSRSFWATLVGKDGKVANRAKLAILSHSEPLRWKKIGKVANQA